MTTLVLRQFWRYQRQRIKIQTMMYTKKLGNETGFTGNLISSCSTWYPSCYCWTIQTSYEMMADVKTRGKKCEYMSNKINSRNSTKNRRAISLHVLTTASFKIILIYHNTERETRSEWETRLSRKVYKTAYTGHILI
jgi:hypothetical protein